MSLVSVGKLLRNVAVKAGPDRLAPTPARTRARLPLAMSLAEAVSIAGTLGKTGKMPGRSYGLDARRCHVGSQMAKVPGSICSTCYALSDFYLTWRAAERGRVRRQASLGNPRWADAMVRQISHHCTPPEHYFRWHDSGDLESVDHLARLVEVCERTPTVRHWLPTREYSMVAEYRRRGGVFPSNLTVRLSALMIDSEPPRAMPGRDSGARLIPDDLADLTTSTTHTSGGQNPVDGKGSIVCRAVDLRDNACGPCRACWSPDVRNVSYPQH